MSISNRGMFLSYSPDGSNIYGARDGAFEGLRSAKGV